MPARQRSRSGIPDNVGYAAFWNEHGRVGQEDPRSYLWTWSRDADS